MAAGCKFLSCLLAVLSAVLTPGYGGYRQIDLTAASGVSCNMSSIYSSKDDTSLACWGALNGNTGMKYSPGGNCVYTFREQNEQNEYWLVNLGQPRNIHRIIIFPETRFNKKTSTRVFVDENKIYQFPTVRVTTAQTITRNLPVRGQIIILTRPGDNVTLCELQVYGCTFDSYGANCTQTCSTGCSENAGDTVCDSITGTCKRGCKPGLAGPKCDEKCPVRCNVPCDAGGCPQCEGNFEEPDCTQCRAGWYGSECVKPCNQHCKPDDDGNSRCGQTDGVCNLGCVDGQYGLHCNVSCPPNCDGGCGREDSVCNSCRNGYFGSRCHSACGTGCVDNCNREDGACNCSTGWSSPNCAECDSGTYGVESCEECGYCRDGDVCNNHNGNCPRGCRTGFHGDRCDKCAGNRWGPNCSLSCGQCAGDGSCDVHTGYCTCGCLQEFEGDNCTLKLASGEDDTQDGGNIAGPLVGGLLGAGALIGISVLLAAFMIIRWRRSRDTSNAADTDGAHFSSGDAPVRDVTEGDKPETETPGNESNYAQLEKNENPDDIRPYSVLEDGDKLPIYLNIQSDQETAVYQNTTVSKN